MSQKASNSLILLMLSRSLIACMQAVAWTVLFTDTRHDKYRLHADNDNYAFLFDLHAV